MNDVQVLVTPPEWYKPCTKRELKPHERAGIVYEEKFGKYANLRWGGDNEIWCGKWLRFRCAKGKFCWAQPDVVVLDHAAKVCYIFECKLTYRPVKAYRQLTGLYLPLMEKLYPEYEMRLVQVCRRAGKRIKPELLIGDAEEPGFRENESVVYGVWNWQPIVM